MFKKILIANRGEIAVRVMKACQELSIPTVAVYSEVDRDALHVQVADEAALLGPPQPSESYLNIDRIIETARQYGVDAIHPGYGFLAENPNFVRRCEQEGITFIGPSSEAMSLVGDKLRSRQTMTEADIPVIPGMYTRATSLKEIMNEAVKLDFPVIIKASAGGGGKGMRVVHSPDELKDAMESGKREAKSAFGDDSVYLEKYIEKPRHIEFQILADQHGHAVYLFERECSIQRRHQKIIEESPSTILTPALRKKMGETAIAVIRASGYTNAGTVEFLLDENKNFYFLEVNARLQVEHPVTEFVTGIDLVKQQLRIAAGEKLSFAQKDLAQKGHAIECRIYAEDPENNFLPSSGKIVFLKEPRGPWIRNDSGIYSGMDVSVYYDPILAKLIVWGENREDARIRMIHALKDYVILGIKTQIPFMNDVLEHPEFIAGNTHTDFIPTHFSQWRLGHRHEKLAAAVAAMQSFGDTGRGNISVQKKTLTPWLSVGHWEI